MAKGDSLSGVSGGSERTGGAGDRGLAGDRPRDRCCGWPRAGRPSRGWPGLCKGWKSTLAGHPRGRRHRRGMGRQRRRLRPTSTRVVDEVEAKFGKIHVLVNNAGVTRDGLMLRMEDDAWKEVIDTNLKGTFLFSRAVGAIMMRGRYGRIINISSVSGLMGNPGQANYSASKAGVIGFSKTVARELASRDITVNVVAPGFITTDMTDVLPEKIKTEVKERVPVRRLGNPEDIADLVCYLSGPGAGYLTGQVIAVDGGMTA